VCPDVRRMDYEESRLSQDSPDLFEHGEQLGLGEMLNTVQEKHLVKGRALERHRLRVAGNELRSSLDVRIVPIPSRPRYRQCRLRKVEAHRLRTASGCLKNDLS